MSPTQTRNPKYYADKLEKIREAARELERKVDEGLITARDRHLAAELVQQHIDVLDEMLDEPPAITPIDEGKINNE